tara:strand:+ start:1599 stop:2264 length:666 start_codon:yes stop_codon:yes gene_type:complete
MNKKLTQKEKTMNTIKNKAGVYRITNTENGKRYYGSSKELRRRWTDHKSMMRTGTHQNPGIKEDAATHGEAAFDFQVLCYCKPEDRKRLEGVLIDQNLGEGCYNRKDGNGGFEQTEEHKANISEALKGKPKSEEHKANMRKPKSEEHKANMSAAKSGKNNPMYGKTHTEEAKANMRKPLSEEHKAKLRKPQPKVTCPHCGLTGGTSLMKRWHFANCDQKPL